ncbi:hypothetical protein EV196_102404 [Mariniflexile fucanivorans]|uniref:Uncharacterized protein n=1 Tax=Mariniflexile fucanivorans TaxID=264023 RepID=A0A4R1RNF1_9FLAO|nr:hypothetical protein [Mariniflexile fucanivorans]TCL67841.1 hypothetical protein EV196_102404 [Mariniflexile fucanivorans]
MAHIAPPYPLNTAKELYEYLNQKSLFNPDGNIKKSEFYINVANKHNTNNKIDAEGRFPYNYKYEKNVGEIQKYVKIVPFRRANISNDILTRFQTQKPTIYKLMQTFNETSNKVNFLEKKDKI